MKLKLALLLGTAINLLGSQADACDPQEDPNASKPSQYNRAEEDQYMLAQLRAMGVDVSQMHAAPVKENEKEKEKKEKKAQPNGPQLTGDPEVDRIIQETWREKNVAEEKAIEKLKAQTLEKEKKREESEIEKVKRLTLQEKKDKEQRAVALVREEQERQDRAYQRSQETDKAKERLKEIDGELAQLAALKTQGEAAVKAATDSLTTAQSELDGAEETLDAATRKCEHPNFKGNPKEEKRKQDAADKVKELKTKCDTLSSALESVITDNLTLTGALDDQEQTLRAEKAKLEKKKS